MRTTEEWKKQNEKKKIGEIDITHIFRGTNKIFPTLERSTHPSYIHFWVGLLDLVFIITPTPR